MKCRSGKKFAYIAQAVVDQESELIVAADVVRDESDNYQLVPMQKRVEVTWAKSPEQTVTDAGYQATTEANQSFNFQCFLGIRLVLQHPLSRKGISALLGFVVF